MSLSHKQLGRLRPLTLCIFGALIVVKSALAAETLEQAWERALAADHFLQASWFFTDASRQTPEAARRARSPLADARQRAIAASNPLDLSHAAYNRVLGRPVG